MPTETSGRKLTTLLAADVAGYSRLTSQDEEGTIAALRKHRTELKGMLELLQTRRLCLNLKAR